MSTHYDSVDKIERALAEGSVSKRQAAAYRAWITMRSTTPPVQRRDHSRVRKTAKPFIPRVRKELAFGTVLRGTVVDYREAWGGRKGRPVVKRFWYVRPDERAGKRAQYWLDTTDWGLSRHIYEYPSIGERVEIIVRANIAREIRADEWRVVGDPIDDLIQGRTSEFVNVRPREGHNTREIVFTISPDQPVGEVNKGGKVHPRYRAYGKSLSPDYLYKPEYVCRFGTAMVARHAQALEQIGITSYLIGSRRFTLKGKAMPRRTRKSGR